MALPLKKLFGHAVSLFDEDVYAFIRFLGVEAQSFTDANQSALEWYLSSSAKFNALVEGGLADVYREADDRKNYVSLVKKTLGQH